MVREATAIFGLRLLKATIERIGLKLLGLDLGVGAMAG